MKDMILDSLYIWLGIPIVLEPFPISSSGHALLLQNIVMLFFPTTISFRLVPAYLHYLTHGPVFIVVSIYFFRAILLFLQEVWRTKQWWNCIVWFCIVGVGTAFWYELFQYSGWQFPLYAGNIFTALCLCSLSFLPDKDEARAMPMSFFAAGVLGMVQGISLLPGISRFGTTFVAARWLSFSRLQAFFISFLIELPISAAACLKGLYGVYHTQLLSEILNPTALFIMVIAGCGAYKGLQYMRDAVEQTTLLPFGMYMFGIAAVTYWLLP